MLPVAETCARRAKLLLISSSRISSDIASIATEAGFERHVCQLQEAFALLASDMYGAALLDVGSREAALAFLASMRISGMRKIPLVAVADMSDLPLVTRAGASFVVPRPVSPELLKKTLQTAYRFAFGQRLPYERYRVDIPLVLGVDGKTTSATATDIGDGGMAVLAPVSLNIGTTVQVRFVLPETNDCVVAAGEIRWSDQYGRAGVCFSQGETAARVALEDWIRRREVGTDTLVPTEPSQEALPIQLSTGHDAADLASRTGRVVLSVVLVVFCCFVAAFWAWLALSS